MRQFGQFHYAALLLILGITGCMTDEVFKLESQPGQVQRNSGPADRFVPRSLETVLHHTQMTLAEFNVLSHASREGDAIRVECFTKTDARFSLVLTTWTTKPQKSTRIHAGWHHDREPESGLNDPIVVAILDRIEKTSCSDPELEHKIDSPPNQPTASTIQWWNATIDRLPVGFLAVYTEVSEIHLRQRTAATYVQEVPTQTKAGWSITQFRLPSPPPQYAVARIKQRLNNYKIGREDTVTLTPGSNLVAEECRGCTEIQAMMLWHQAESKVHQLAQQE